MTDEYIHPACRSRQDILHPPADSEQLLAQVRSMSEQDIEGFLAANWPSSRAASEGKN